MDRTINEIAAELARHEAKGNVSTRTQRVPHADARTEEDAAYRRAYGTGGKAPYGKPLRAAFYQYLPESPRHTSANEDECRRYVRQIDETLEQDCWSGNERERLRQLRKIWNRRATGRDARYLTHGNAGGKTNKVWKAHAAPGSARMVFTEVQQAIVESNARYFEAMGSKVVRDAPPEQKFVVDKRWPMGRANPSRRV